MNKNMTLTFVQ